MFFYNIHIFSYFVMLQQYDGERSNQTDIAHTTAQGKIFLGPISAAKKACMKSLCLLHSFQKKFSYCQKLIIKQPALITLELNHICDVELFLKQQVPYVSSIHSLLSKNMVWIILFIFSITASCITIQILMLLITRVTKVVLKQQLRETKNTCSASNTKTV